MKGIDSMMNVMMILATAVLLTGCAMTQRHGELSSTSPRIELLGFDGCPNTPIMTERLRDALEQLDADAAVAKVDQESLAEDDLRRGYPAPTVLVDGRDLFGMAVPERPSMGCRMYQGPGGVPTTDDLARRLTAKGIGGKQP